MSRRLKVAVRLHAGADGTAADAPEHARHAEQLGLDGIFVGDHLKPAGAYPESMVVLAAVAASTERIHVGVGVMVLALRALRRAARHCAGWCPRYGHAPADRRRRPQRPDNAQIAVGGMALLEADVTDPRHRPVGLLARRRPWHPA
jgi:alkanesulfonate monooxygenase SsuD/methylene tetrahydromethanopterin reductase-like flavin-dependent oxidoreductase (luciferase family)